MAASETNSPAAVGFLTVVEHPQLGFCGGYLILNANGRPLEFHCTAPIKPNRAQEILYGPTLAPFLFGEQIGQTLVTKAAIKPLAVCTDVAPVLAMRSLVAMPAMLVLEPEEDRRFETAASDASLASIVGAPTDACTAISPDAVSIPIRDERRVRFDRPRLTAVVPLARFRLGKHEAAVELLHGGDRELLAKRLEMIAQTLDLCEPFGRIREALDEAQRGGK